jgi:hypothetical protein
VLGQVHEHERGLNCQITSFGHASRRPPPANPQPTANGIAQLTGHEGGNADQEADQRASIGTGDQPRQKRALQGQVGGVVVEEQAEGDARHQRHGQRQSEHQPIDPPAPLEDEDVAEPPVAGQHGGQHRHHGQLDDERREEELVRGEETRLLEHRSYLKAPGSRLPVSDSKNAPKA